MAKLAEILSNNLDDGLSLAGSLLCLDALDHGDVSFIFRSSRSKKAESSHYLHRADSPTTWCHEQKHRRSRMPI